MNKRTNKNCGRKLRIKLFACCTLCWICAFPARSISQVTDTVEIGKTVSYCIGNRIDGSMFHWKATKGTIVSVNPTQSNSIQVTPGCGSYGQWYKNQNDNFWLFSPNNPETKVNVRLVRNLTASQW